MLDLFDDIPKETELATSASTSSINCYGDMSHEFVIEINLILSIC